MSGKPAVFNVLKYHAAKWLPFVVLPLAMFLLGKTWPAWILMWGLAFSIYAGLKWASWYDCSISPPPTWARQLGYLFLWPGMKAKAFLGPRSHDRNVSTEEVWSAVGKMLIGLTLFVVVAPYLISRSQILAAWIGMIGFIFTMHFGLFHVLSCLWRRMGINAEKLMDQPIDSSSLSDFWGNRWNRAFRDLSYRFLFKPSVGRLGPAGATMLVFGVSGVIHELVISSPAGGGWGLPTFYFVLQGAGLLLERSPFGKSVGLSRGWRGRLFCGMWLIIPVPLLFHVPFQEKVVLPMLAAIENWFGVELALYLPWLVFLGGIIHFGTLSAGIMMTKVLNWKTSLKVLDPVSQHVIWVHGTIVFMTIITFGLFSVFLADEMAAGTTLAKAICAFIAIFWGSRLVAQFFLFDPKEYLTNWFLKLGYHGLTVVFFYHTIVYGCAALA